MSLDRSLKSHNALVRHRNVLSRDERIAKLVEEEKWEDGRSAFGLPKVAHRKVATKKAAKEAAAAAAEAPVEGAAAPAEGAAAPAAAPAADKGKKDEKSKGKK